MKEVVLANVLCRDCRHRKLAVIFESKWLKMVELKDQCGQRYREARGVERWDELLSRGFTAKHKKETANAIVKIAIFHFLEPQFLFFHRLFTSPFQLLQDSFPIKRIKIKQVSSGSCSLENQFLPPPHTHLPAWLPENCLSLPRFARLSQDSHQQIEVQSFWYFTHVISRFSFNLRRNNRRYKPSVGQTEGRTVFCNWLLPRFNPVIRKINHVFRFKHQKSFFPLTLCSLLSESPNLAK